MVLETENKELRDILKTKKGKTYTVLGITVLTILALFFFAIRPAWVSITDKLAENEAKSKYINDSENKISTIQNVLRDLYDNEDAVSKLDTYLSEKIIQSFVLENLTPMASTNNVKLQYLKFEHVKALTDDDPTVNATYLAKNDFTINISGQLNDLQQFLFELERFPMIINLTAINLMSVEVGEVLTEPWQITLQGSIYLWDINDIKDFYNV